MAVAVEAGLATALAIMADEAARCAGRGTPGTPERDCERGGTTATSVVMGGQRLPIRRPGCMRSSRAAAAARCRLRRSGCSPGRPADRHGAGADAGGRGDPQLRTGRGPDRRRHRGGRPVHVEECGVPPVRDRHQGRPRRACWPGTCRALAPVVLMIDGTDFGGATCVVALVVTGDGTKVPVGLRVGDTENKTVVTALLADLVERGLDPAGGLLVVIDGAKALAAAVRAVFGDWRSCSDAIHKRRNVADHLPKTERETVDARLRGAFADPDPPRGLRKAQPWPPSWTGPTPTRPGRCAKASRTCSPCAAWDRRDPGPDADLHEHDRVDDFDRGDDCRNVKHWQDKGDMRRRWCAAGLLEAEGQVPPCPRPPPDARPRRRARPPRPSCHTAMPD